MNGHNMTTDRRTQLRAVWDAEMQAARTAKVRGATGEEWAHLERAHILSQPLAGPHVRTHIAMFGVALRRRDRRELVGQAFRMIVAGPASLAGKYPVGNTGGADVSAFEPMPVPEDLRQFLPAGKEAS